MNIKKSSVFLTVDRSEDFNVPTNSDVLTGSLVTGYRNSVPERLFADIQDTNYYSNVWNNLRYKGVENRYDSTKAYFPLLSLESFQGVRYSLTATSGSIFNVTDSSRQVQTFYLGGDPQRLLNIKATDADYVTTVETSSGYTKTLTITLRDYTGASKNVNLAEYPSGVSGSFVLVTSTGGSTSEQTVVLPIPVGDYSASYQYTSYDLAI